MYQPLGKEVLALMTNCRPASIIRGRLRRVTGLWIIVIIMMTFAAARPLVSGSQKPRRYPTGWIEEKSVLDRDIWIRWFDGRSTVEVKIKGSVRFSANEIDIEAISSDGFLLITQQVGNATMTFAARPGDSGKLNRSFATQGSSTKSGARETAWLAKMLPNVLRNTGLNAPKRVQRIFRRDGVSGVLREISLIRSDRVKQIYYRDLIEGKNFTVPVLRQVMRHVARQISSDEIIASLLIETADAYVDRENSATAAYFQNLDGITSDESHESVLLALLQRKSLRRHTVLHVIKSAGEISSDAVKVNVMLKSLSTPTADTTVASALLDQLKTISADEEKARLLLVVLDMNGLDQTILQRIQLLANEEITSGTSQQAVLRKIDQRKSEASKP